MALRKTHIVVSELIVTLGIITTNPQVPIELVSMLGVWCGAQLPDVDLANTRVNHWFGPLGPLLAALPHRTWTHSLWAVIVLLVGALLMPVPQEWLDPTRTLNYGRLSLLMLCAGYLLHLLEDAFSDHGVPWLYPWHGRPEPHWRWHYRTGGRFETVVRRSAWVLLWGAWYWLFRTAYLSPI